MASRGAKIVVNDNGVSRYGEGGDAGRAQAVVNEIRKAGGEAVGTTDSVASPDGAKATVDAAVKRYGRLDILIHSAGVNRAHTLA